MDELTGHAPYTPITVGAKTTPTDAPAMYCEEGQCEFNGLMEALKAKDAANARLREALTAIAGFGDVNLSGEWEPGLRDIIRSMTDRAKTELRSHQQTTRTGE